MPAQRYAASKTLAEMSTMYDVPCDSDVEVKVSLTRYDVWDAKATPQ